MAQASRTLAHQRNHRTHLQRGRDRVTTQCRLLCRLKSLSFLACVGVSDKAGQPGMTVMNNAWPAGRRRSRESHRKGAAAMPDSTVYQGAVHG
jgi:hypothetical protein